MRQPWEVPLGSMPFPGNQESRTRAPCHFQECSNTWYHFHIASPGRPLACPGPEPGEPSHFLMACRILDDSHEIWLTQATGPNLLVQRTLKAVVLLTFDFHALMVPVSRTTCKPPAILLDGE